MEIKDNYQRWLNHPNLDANLKKELENMDEKQINDAFYTNVEFGTAGMRGVLGAGTNRINIHTIRKANEGFAKYIMDNGKEACDAGVAIGYDNRHMSKEFAFDSAKVLASHNIRCYVFESLRPTPELSFAVRELKCFGGIMITASHNPREYNGYKLYDSKGCQLVPHLAAKVVENVNAIKDELAINPILTDEQEKLISVIGKEIDEKYYERVLSIQLNPNVDKSKVKFVFSPEHGTSAIPVKTLFERVGYQLICVEEQMTPDPDFSNTPTPNPEERRAYDLALEYAKKNDANVILVCDPDADRMGVAVKDKDELHVLTGNQSGAVLIEYIFSQLKKQGRLPKNGVMFNTVVTGDLGEKIADSYGVETEKTLTGFKFIGEKVAKYEVNHEKEYVFGYEESYGSLISPFVRDKDAPQACSMLAEAACYYNEQGKTLWDVLNELYAKLGYYDESQTSISLKGEEGAKKIKEIIAKLRANRLTKIADATVIGWEDYGTCEKMKDGKVVELTGFTRSEVLKYYLDDGSWIAIRPSGTEPKMKIYYCIKGSSLADAKSKASIYQQAMKEITA